MDNIIINLIKLFYSIKNVRNNLYNLLDLLNRCHRILIHKTIDFLKMHSIIKLIYIVKKKILCNILAYIHRVIRYSFIFYSNTL